ncbi:hypothetical protein JTB14_002983 [Gonioctena quinquepunctata]|nr:hypothetical protein JTB14_002983 [Gonioctena quinquepunctata]
MSVEIKGICSMRSQTNDGLVPLEFKPLRQDYPLMFTEAVILEKMCDLLPADSLSTHEWGHIQSLNLADPNYYKPVNIDVSLGADIFAEILLNASIAGFTNIPIAIYFDGKNRGPRLHIHFVTCLHSIRGKLARSYLYLQIILEIGKRTTNRMS